MIMSAPALHPDTLAALERCDREIAEIQNRPGPDKAYLTVLGMNDWAHERRLILAGDRAVSRSTAEGAK